MSLRSLRISDISGEVIKSDDDVVTMVVLDHSLIDQPVQLDISKAEADSLDIEQDDYVILELVSQGGDKRERCVMSQVKFDKLFTTLAVDEVLSEADKYGNSQPQPLPPRASNGSSVTDKVDYTATDNFGALHRGKTTEREAELVRGNLEQANANRKRRGQPEINPADAKDKARYGF